MEKDKKVTALYCRLSKDDGSNSESLSIRTQKAMLMEYATRNGFGNCQYYKAKKGSSVTDEDPGRAPFGFIVCSYQVMVPVPATAVT